MQISDTRLKDLSDKEYRSSYLREMTIGWIVHQIRALREQRGWSQAKLGEELGKPQSAIARIEKASYGNWNVNTLLELAEGFDVALQVRFVDWPCFIDRTEDTAPTSMWVSSFDPAAFSTKSADIGSTNIVSLATFRPRGEVVLNNQDKRIFRVRRGSETTGPARNPMEPMEEIDIIDDGLGTRAFANFKTESMQSESI